MNNDDIVLKKIANLMLEEDDEIFLKEIEEVRLTPLSAKETRTLCSARISVLINCLIPKRIIPLRGCVLHFIFNIPDTRGYHGCINHESAEVYCRVTEIIR